MVLLPCLHPTEYSWFLKMIKDSSNGSLSWSRWDMDIKENIDAIISFLINNLDEGQLKEIRKPFGYE